MMHDDLAELRTQGLTGLLWPEFTEQFTREEGAIQKRSSRNFRGIPAVYLAVYRCTGTMWNSIKLVKN